jgi:pimeloyl-ACP methyl ester carboxylesterase
MPTAAGIYYYEHGGGGQSKQVLLLIHGAGGVKEQWPHQLRRLRGWRVLAPDLPGHGRSKGTVVSSIEGHAQELWNWMEALELPPAVVVGHSMGGAIALALALARPETVRGLILLGCAAQMPVNPGLLDRLAVPGQLQPAAHSIAQWSYAKDAKPALVRSCYEQLMATRPGELHRDFLACNDFDVRKRIGELRMPALVLSGSEDRMITPTASKAMADELRRAEWRSIEGVGHMLMLEKPREVQTAVEDFLMKL